ncbi:hypothetical protein [Anabaena sp. UHCC 0451]|uniref:hypothetical protein n=1 Tax=Anabaena sp. UHCC 0451 TaxID=2055235 RepID=UPI002B1F169C|nr:hypothetical protein [Anabaena sp. UHCC 0451]MEA5577707.1 hypothetical protein [Anabaena sp. UHCC 0451]
MNLQKYTQLFGIICGGLLISLPTISQVAIAQETTAKVNPCPGIFYEEPHNFRVLVPAGCPPNAFTLRLMQLGIIPLSIIPLPDPSSLGVGGEAPSALNPNPSIFNEPPYNLSQRAFQSGGDAQTVPTLPPSSRTQLPAPEQRQDPSTRMALADGKANIKLINNTGASITYQVIGDTAPRTLEGKSDVTLRGLNTPITVTFQRKDRGLLMVTPKPGEETGTLEVTLKETTDVNQDRSAMRIQSNGSVFLN